jgi:hypothetical protein
MRSVPSCKIIWVGHTWQDVKALSYQQENSTAGNYEKSVEAIWNKFPIFLLNLKLPSTVLSSKSFGIHFTVLIYMILTSWSVTSLKLDAETESRNSSLWSTFIAYSFYLLCYLIIIFYIRRAVGQGIGIIIFYIYKYIIYKYRGIYNYIIHLNIL